jgi:hypothetical protein
MKTLKQTARGACSILVLASTAALMATAQSVTHTPWEVHEGNEPTQDDGKAYFKLGSTHSSHGDKAAYAKAKVPGENDGGWINASESDVANRDGTSMNDKTIGLVRTSNLPAGAQNCRSTVDYTYFQTFVDVPENTSIDEFEIKFNGMDDGSRITMFNNEFPNGQIVEGSYVKLGGSETSDLRDLLVPGRNRVVITQVDDCASQNNLRSAMVVLNGTALEVAEEPDADRAPMSNPVLASRGDVHITTNDGLRYDYQGVGDFILHKRVGETKALAVARQRPWEGKPAASVNKAVVFMVGADTVQFSVQPERLLVNGVEKELVGQTLPGGGRIKVVAKDDYYTYWPDNGFAARAYLRSQSLDFGAINPGGKPIEGMLGNMNGNASDDMTVRGGTALKFPPSAKDLARFGESWRADKNYFSEPHPEKPQASDELVAGVELSEAEREEAARKCRAGGVTHNAALEDCAYDVAVTGSAEFIESAKAFEESVAAQPVKPQLVAAKAEPKVTLEQINRIPDPRKIRSLSELMAWDQAVKAEAAAADEDEATVDSIFPIAGEFFFERNEKYFSPSGNHYLIYQNDGNVVVYTKDDGFVWGLNEQTDRYASTAIITKQTDGNLVAYDADKGYIWSARHEASPAGTTLTLQSSGALEIVAPSGDVLWSSKQ